MTRHLRIYDHFAIPHLSNTATAWRMPPQHPPGSEGSRRDGCGTRGQNRCPGAAAGPGRASRSITPSRRLACGDLAGGPPPTGTWTIGSAAVTREALHPLGNAAPNQEGCNANRWGARPHRQQAQMWIGRMQQRLGLQRVPHAGRLFRTRAACPVHGRGCPDSEQQAHVRMRRPHQSTQSTNPSNTTRPITPHVDLLGWKAPLDLLGLRGLLGLRDPAGHQIDRFEPQARGALTAGRTAPGSRARQCRCVQPSHRPPSYHPAQPGAGALGPRRRGGQSRGSRATGG